MKNNKISIEQAIKEYNEIKNLPKEEQPWALSEKLKLWKPLFDEETELYNRYVFAKIDDIKFGMWLANNGYEFYDGDDRLINLKGGNTVSPITQLFAEYKKENQKHD